MKKLVIIDSYALIHRSYHALPPLTSPQGVLVNGVYGFMLFFLKMINDLNPDYIVAAFDRAEETFRHQEYKEYKARRVKMPDNFYEQVQIVKSVLEAFRVPILEKEGYEADDIIGTVVANVAARKDIDSFIVTGDLDTLQLVGDKVFVYTFRRGIQDMIIYDADKVRERFDLDPAQMKDWKALRGDPSDNVPGVPAIGEKTASTLIKQFGDLDNLYRHLEEGLPVKASAKILANLKEYKDQAYFSRHLVTIQQDVNIEFDLAKAEFTPPDRETLIPLLNDLGFTSLISRIFNRPEQSPQPPRAALVKVGGASSGGLSVEQLRKKVIAADTIGVLLDAAGDKFGERDVKGMGISLPTRELFYLPPKQWDKFFQDQLDWKSKTVVSYDAKVLLEEFDFWKGCQLEDVKILSWLLDADRKNYQFAAIVKSFLGKDIEDDFGTSLAQLIPLWEKLHVKIEALGLDNVWETEEKPLIPIIAAMEKNGILADPRLLRQLQEKTSEEILALKTKIYKLAGKEFNVNSPAQLAAVLFEDLHIPRGSLKKTSTKKISTDAGELMKIKEAHQIVPHILEYRSLEKLKNSFLDTLPKFINPHTGRIHAVWNQTGTATGRLSSEQPNLQNIPQKGETGALVRQAFLAADSYSLVSLDYSQIELRLAAHLSGDDKMIETFQQNKDIHVTTAAYVNSVPEEKVTPVMRQRAKALNFGIIYGMGNRSFAVEAGLSVDEAKDFREKYFANFPGLKNYLDFSLENAKKLGYAETIFGRKRFLPLLGGLGRTARAQERIALNMPIQGLAADILKLAMIKMQDFIAEQGKEKEIKALVQIHDELILEIKSGIIDQVGPVFKDIMEKVVPLKVPLLVEVRTGRHWGEIK